MLKDNPKVKTSFCYIHFGKQFKELNADEVREFRRLMKAKKRAESEEQREYDRAYAKAWTERNRDKMREYHKRYYAKEKFKNIAKNK